MGEKTQNVRERKERERARAHLDRSLALLAPSFPCLGSKTVFSSSFLARLGSTFVRVVAFFSSSFSVPKRVVFSSLLSLSLFATFTKNPPTTRGTRAEGLFSRVSFVCSLSSLARWSKASSSSCKAVPFMCLKETPLWWACLGFYTWRVFERGKHPTVGKGQHNFERRSFLYEWCHKIHTGKQHKT